MDRNLEPLAEAIESVELVIDQCLQRADVERPDAAFRLFDYAGADGQECRLSLSARRCRSDDDVAPSIKNRVNRPFLDIAQLRPALIPHPSLNVSMQPVETGGCLVAWLVLRA